MYNLLYIIINIFLVQNLRKMKNRFGILGFGNLSTIAAHTPIDKYS